jgi:hypothetical protein
MVGIRSLIGEGSRLSRVICMGNDYYESRESIDDFAAAGIPKIGIGTYVFEARVNGELAGATMLTVQQARAAAESLH